MESGKIYEAIASVMKDVGAVEKNQQTQMGNRYKYRGIDDVMNALNPAMAKHKIFVVPEVLENTREDRKTGKGYELIYTICKIKYTFYAVDGSNVSATVVGEAMDSGDKSTNKAMSVAFKYACFQTFCIPTEEMQDPDGAVYENIERVKTEAEMQIKQEEIERQAIGQAKINTIKNELKRTGVSEKSVLDRYSVKKLEDITEKQYPILIRSLKITKPKEEK